LARRHWKKILGLIATLVVVLALVLYSPGVSVTPGGGMLSIGIEQILAEDAIGSEYAYAVVNKSGCCEYHGNVQIRIDFYLTPDALRYDDCLVQVIDTTSSEYLEGYKGELDKNGQPVDLDDYQKWLDSLPTIEQLNPFHSHFVYLSPTEATEAKIKELMEFHLPNFYKAFQEYRDKELGGMRHGWAVETRVEPTRYDETLSQLEYETLKNECESKIAELPDISIEPESSGEGKSYPSTDIDVGADAIDRSGALSRDYTHINRNNSSNDSGTLDTVEVYFDNSTAESVEVATFFLVSSSNYSTRGNVPLGNISPGSKQTITGLSISIETGDYIGVYFADSSSPYSKIECNTTSGARDYRSGDCIPCTNQSFSGATGTISLYGTGETVAGYDVSSSPPTIDIGTVNDSSTYYAKGSAPSNPVQDSECTFTITNNGSQCDLDIEITDFTGGTSWNIVLGSPSTNEVRVTTYYSGQDPSSGLVLSNSPQEFYDALAASATLKWDFKLETGVLTDEPNQHSATITVTATAED